MEYVFDVRCARYHDGVEGVDSPPFKSLSKTKKYVEKLALDNVVIKIQVKEDGWPIRFVKKVWVFKKGKWHTTRHVSKYAIITQ